MEAPTVRTLTLNPTIDISSDTEKVMPTHKVRTTNDRLDPGGGGINVSRVLHRFGIATEALFLAGGTTGHVLDQLLERQGIERTPLWIAGDTRLSLTVHETSTRREFRFVPEGPTVEQHELAAMFEEVRSGSSEYFVASGSLPRGVPDDTYCRVLSDARATGAKVLLDTSGAELRAALACGGLFLVKPSRGELQQLSGRTLDSHSGIAAAARELVEAGQAQQIAVTLGRDGAMFINQEGAWFLPAVPVTSESAVGAGDSFLAGMIIGFATGKGPLEAFRLGLAAGTATAMTPGTDLCHPEQVEHLLSQVAEPRPIN